MLILAKAKVRGFFSREINRLQISGRPAGDDDVMLLAHFGNCSSCGERVVDVAGAPWPCDLSEVRWALPVETPDGGPGPIACAMTEAWITPHVCRAEPKEVAS